MALAHLNTFLLLKNRLTRLEIQPIHPASRSSLVIHHSRRLDPAVTTGGRLQASSVVSSPLISQPPDPACPQLHSAASRPLEVD